MPEDPDEIVRTAVESARATLEQADAAPGSAIGENKNLQPAIVASLRARFGDRTWPNAARSIPSWVNVGHVDVALKSLDGYGLTAAVELKSDKIDESPWDLFKMALLSTSEDVLGAYLVTAARATNWSSDCCRDIFQATRHDTSELCRLRYPSSKLVWDVMLKGGYGNHPGRVPSLIATSRVATEPLVYGGKAWEIRAIRVSAATNEYTAFTGGWPNGDRPPEAKYPLLSAG